MSTVADDALRCPACGAGLEPGAAFCASCGARVALAPAGAGVPAGVDAGAHGWSLGTEVDDAVAPVWRRLLALLLDQLLAAAVGGAGLLAVLPAVRDGSTGALLVPALLLLLLTAGQWFAEAFAGRTVGGAALGIRTVSARTGRPAGLWPVLVRSVVQGLGVVVGGIGVYVVAGSGAWDEGPEQRGWHDKAAGTLVLRARRARTAEAAGSAGSTAPGAADAGAAPGSAAPGSAAPAGAAPEPVPGPAAVALAAAPVRDTPDDLPDSTVPTGTALGDLEHTRVGRWAAGAESVATALVLTLDTGATVPVSGPGLIGRRPVPGTERWAHLVTVEDPEQSVSSTHLAFWPVAGGLDVLDRGSTNGTVLVDPAGKPWSLAPGAPARVAAGWTLVLGNRRIRVDAA